MKRIAIAIVTALVAVLVPVTLTTSPANASEVSVSKQYKRACSTTHYYKNATGSFSAKGATTRTYHQTVEKVRYQNCGTFHKVWSYQLTINNTGGGCGDVDRWEVNPNAIGPNGQWNPGTKAAACSNGVTFLWQHPSSVVVAQNYPANERCIASAIHAEYSLWPNDTFTSNGVCFF